MRIKVFKIGKFLTSVSVICIILVTTLHISSNSFKYSIFKDPGDLEDWQDHIQVIILLKGINIMTIYFVHDELTFHSNSFEIFRT